MTPAVAPSEPASLAGAEIAPDGWTEDTATDAAWSEQFADQPAAAAEAEQQAEDIGHDFYTTSNILDAATFVTGVVAVPGDRLEVFTTAVAEATGPESKAAWLLDQIELGKALAEVGIRPSRGLSRLPRWARIVGGLGAVAYVVGTAYKVAVSPPAPSPAAGPGRGPHGVANPPGEAPGVA
ncbi:MAG TPA: hypothetical protein VKA64_02920 [Gammaproteobacteria bacterium]|nr:hypothetical protein [Gammaproteobacteria bacterium]